MALKPKIASFRCKICSYRDDNNHPITGNIFGKDLPDVIEHISGIQISALNVARVFVCETCAVGLIQAESMVQKLRQSLSKVTKKKLHRKPNVQIQKKESDGAESHNESINNDIAPIFQQTEQNLTALESSSSQKTINEDAESDKDESDVEKRELEVIPPKKAAAKRNTSTASVKRKLNTSQSGAEPLIEIKNSKLGETDTIPTEFKTPKKATPRKKAPTTAAKSKLDISQIGGTTPIETNNLNKTDEEEGKIVEINANTPEPETAKKAAVVKRKTPTAAAKRKLDISLNGAASSTETNNLNKTDEEEGKIVEINANTPEPETAKKAAVVKRKTPTAAAKRKLDISLNGAASSTETNNLNKTDEEEGKVVEINANTPETKTPRKAVAKRKTYTAAAKRKLDISLNGAASSAETNNFNKTDEEEGKVVEINANTPETKTPKKAVAKRKTPTAAAKRKLDISLNGAASSAETNNLNKTDEEEGKVVQINANTPETKTPKKAVAKRKTPTTAAQRKKVIPDSIELKNSETLETETSFTNKPQEEKEIEVNKPKATTTPKTNKNVVAKKTPAKRKQINVDSVALEKSNQLETLNDTIQNGEDMAESVQHVTIPSTNVKAITPKKEPENSKAKKSTPLTAAKNSVFRKSNSAIKNDGEQNDDSDSDSKVEANNTKKISQKQLKSILKKKTPVKFEIKFEPKTNSRKKELKAENTDELVASLINSGPLIEKTKNSSIIAAKSIEDQELSLIDIGSLFDQMERPNPLETYNKDSDYNSKFENLSSNGEPQEDYTQVKDTAYKAEGASTVQKTLVKSKKVLATKKKTPIKLDDKLESKKTTVNDDSVTIEDPKESSLIDLGELFAQAQNSPKKDVKRKRLNDDFEKNVKVEPELNETQESQLNYTIDEEEKSQDDNADSSSGAKKNKKKNIEGKKTAYKAEGESMFQKTLVKPKKVLATTRKTPIKLDDKLESKEDPKESSLIDLGELFAQAQNSPQKAVKRKRLNEDFENNINFDLELNETQESQLVYTIDEEEKSQDDNGDSYSGAKKKKKIEGNFQCQHCAYETVTVKHFEKHLKKFHQETYHGQSHISNNDEQLELICTQPDCSRTFTSQASLSSHLTKRHPHVKQHTCVVCGKSFALITDLRSHMDNRHMGDVFACANCATTFRSQPKYEAHVFSEKCKNAVHQCQYCERQFSIASKMRHHVEKKHPGVVIKEDDVLD